MTKEEAIKRLKEGEPRPDIYDLKWDIALDMAISALSENKGEWVFDDECHEHGHCSKCGYGKVYGEVDLADGKIHNFCPNCGADMRGDDEEKDPWEYMDDIEREEAREYLESLQDLAEWEGGNE